MEKYVIISSDDNKMYKDFYEIVSEQWLRLGYKTYFINITDKNEITNNNYGVVHKIKKLDEYPISFQTQIVRLFSSNLIDGKILISDIDMLPLNGNYFDSFFNILEKNPDKLLLLSGQPYSDVPYYPMCYILANSKILSDSLEINNMSFKNFCDFVSTKVGIKWNSDEHFLYEQILKIDNSIVYTRSFNSRIDRSNWTYDENLLKNGFYLDSHLLRPFENYKQEINTLINKLNYGTN
jgi:hypothetical protein